MLKNQTNPGAFCRLCGRFLSPDAPAFARERYHFCPYCLYEVTVSDIARLRGESKEDVLRLLGFEAV